MKKAGHYEELGILTLEFVFAYAAHMRRFIQPESKHQVLYDHLFRASFGPVLGEIYRRNCSSCVVFATSTSYSRLVPRFFLCYSKRASKHFSSFSPCCSAFSPPPPPPSLNLFFVFRGVSSILSRWPQCVVHYLIIILSFLSLFMRVSSCHGS